MLGVANVSRARQDLATASAPPPIEIVAMRFAFEPSRIEVEQGDTVRLVVRSADGVHGLALKKFKVDRRIPRGGEPVTIEFVAAEPGTFPILCSEFCGKGHESMTGTLVVSVRKP